MSLCLLRSLLRFFVSRLLSRVLTSRLEIIHEIKRMQEIILYNESPIFKNNPKAVTLIEISKWYQLHENWMVIKPPNLSLQQELT